MSLFFFFLIRELGTEKIGVGKEFYQETSSRGQCSSSDRDLFSDGSSIEHWYFLQNVKRHDAKGDEGGKEFFG